MASNPQLISCPENTWTKVATAVKSGMIYPDKWTDINNRLSEPITYFHTYRLTGEPLPPDPYPISEEVKISNNGAIISSSVDIDVYIYCRGGNGSIRLDV